MPTYDRYPAVDEDGKFPPEVRVAFANSEELEDKVDSRLDGKIQAGEFYGFTGLVPDPNDEGVFIPVTSDDFVSYLDEPEVRTKLNQIISEQTA